MTFGMEKLEWRGYPTVKKYEDMVTCFERMYERDRRIHRRTPHDSIGRACIASRSNNWAYQSEELINIW